MNKITAHYLEILKNITSKINLVVASKYLESHHIIELYKLGQRDFAENYVNQLQKRQIEFKDLDIVWHFIGNIQSNKIKKIATCEWVQSLTNKSHAKLLNQNAIQTINVLIEINVSKEITNHGLISQEELIELSNYIMTLPNLKLRGIMVIAIQKDDENIYKQFSYGAKLFKNLQQNFNNTNIDTLSMGMSNDYKIAINCGSTMIRIGRGLLR